MDQFLIHCIITYLDPCVVTEWYDFTVGWNHFRTIDNSWQLGLSPACCWDWHYSLVGSVISLHLPCSEEDYWSVLYAVEENRSLLFIHVSCVHVTLLFVLKKSLFRRWADLELLTEPMPHPYARQYLVWGPSLVFSVDPKMVASRLSPLYPNTELSMRKSFFFNLHRVSGNGCHDVPLRVSKKQ